MCEVLVVFSSIMLSPPKSEMFIVNVPPSYNVTNEIDDELSNKLSDSVNVFVI